MEGCDTSPETLRIELPRRGIDDDALEAVRHLQSEGYTAYLVGGGVRDLLLGRQPKDFDISTSARPAVVRRLFRNAMLIGRRFQIVHLRFGPRVFEVSCFRKREEPPDGSMRPPLSSENTYGSPRDDAFARDFTVNALFYDPVRRVIIDHVGGMKDLQAGVLRSVGAAGTWFYEDPVRILRAAKFAGKLDFSLPDAEREAMRERAPLLHICPPSRVTEELFRILEGGSAAASYRILWETGVLAEVLPELDDCIEPSGEGECCTLALLQALDRLVRAHDGLPRDFLFSALFYPAVRARCNDEDGAPGPAGLPCCEAGGPPGERWAAMAEEWLRERTLKLHIPRAYRARQRAVMTLAGNVLTPGHKIRLGRLPRQAAFPDLMALLRLHHRLFEDVSELYNALRRRADKLGVAIVPPLHRVSARHPTRSPRRGRAGRSRRRSGPDTPSP